MCLKLFWSWSCIEIFIIYQLLWSFTATMEIFDVEANNFEFYFKKIGSIVLTLTDVWVLINIMKK